MPGLLAIAASQAQPDVRVRGQHGNTMAQGRGDRAYARKTTEAVPCTLFKAFKSTNRLAKPSLDLKYHSARSPIIIYIYFM